MVSTERARHGCGCVLLFGVGVGLLALHAAHAAGETSRFVTLLFGLLLPAGLVVAVLLAGGWLLWRGIDPDHALRLGAWSVAGAVVLAAGAVLTILHEQAEGVAMTGRLFVVTNAASRGYAVGAVVGFYDGRQRATRAEADRLSRQLTILNRVLRHDIRNEAMIIKGNAELLTENVAEVEQRARRIERQVADLVELGEQARTVERLLHGSDERETVDLASLVERYCERLRAEYPEVRIETSLPASVPASAHPLVDSAVGNVIENAVEHNDAARPEVVVESAVVTHDGTEFVELRIADNGPGIPEGEVAVLERGYETALEHTSGLGLWLVNWIVRQSGGRVRFEANEPEGSVVRLQFERAADGATSASPGTAPADDGVPQPS